MSEERVKTPQARTSKAEALRAGAELAEARVDERRAQCIALDKVQTANAHEATLLDAVYWGTVAGRLRAMAEQAVEEEER